MKDIKICQITTLNIINPQTIKLQKMEHRWRVTINDLMEFTIESADQLPDWIIQNSLNRQVGWTRTITITETWPEGRNAIDEVHKRYKERVERNGGIGNVGISSGIPL